LCWHCWTSQQWHPNMGRVRRRYRTTSRSESVRTECVPYRSFHSRRNCSLVATPNLQSPSSGKTTHGESNSQGPSPQPSPGGRGRIRNGCETGSALRSAERGDPIPCAAMRCTFSWLTRHLAPSCTDGSSARDDPGSRLEVPDSVTLTWRCLVGFLAGKGSWLRAVGPQLRRRRIALLDKPAVASDWLYTSPIHSHALGARGATSVEMNASARTAGSCHPKTLCP